MPFTRVTATNKILELKKRIRIVSGGTAASKTISILLCLIDEAQSDKKPTLTSVVSESFPHLKRGVIRDFLNILQEHNCFEDSRWNKTDYIYTFPGGSQIEFFSADQPGKVRGPRRQRLFLNEANNISFDTFEQLEVRTEEFVFIDFNPVAEFWVHTEVMKRDDVEFITLTYLDNEALNSEIIRSIEQRKNRPNWWKVYGLGQLGEMEGKIYTGWNIIDELPHEARLERYGLDFGYTHDPAAIVAVFYWNGGYILDEIFYQLEASNKQIADTFENMKKALVIADSAEPKSIAEIRGFKINIAPCDKGRDSVRYGIKLMQDQQISVTKRSINLIKEYRNYKWLVDKDGVALWEPEDAFNDLLDATRYAMTSLIPLKRRQEYINSLPVPRGMTMKEQENPAI